MRENISIAADIAGLISLIISFITLLLTARIRKSLLSHVEASDYRQDIDEQIQSLDAIHNLLLKEDGSFPTNLFTQLTCRLSEIKIAYETILRRKVVREISTLITLSSTLETTTQYNQQQISKCIRQLSIVIVELKKEKKIL